MRRLGALLVAVGLVGMSIDAAADDIEGIAVGAATSVAVDGTTILVGGGGEARFLEYQAGEWVEAAHPTSDDPTFGFTVDVRGDLAIISDFSGVSFFRRNGGSWSLTGRHDLPPTGIGFSVAIDGRFAVVGVQSRGRALVFRDTGSGWRHIRTLSRGTAKGRFGDDVDLVGPFVAVSYSNHEWWVFDRTADWVMTRMAHPDGVFPFPFVARGRLIVGIDSGDRAFGGWRLTSAGWESFSQDMPDPPLVGVPGDRHHSATDGRSVAAAVIGPGGSVVHVFTPQGRGWRHAGWFRAEAGASTKVPPTIRPDQIGMSWPFVALLVDGGERLAIVDAESCDGLTPTIYGTGRNDRIVGTEGDDVISGFGGNDRIEGGGGNDVICGGSGDDLLLGGTGNDRILGGQGDDRIDGGGDDDDVDGGPDRDRITFRSSPGPMEVDATGTASGHGDDAFVNIEVIEGSVHGDVFRSAPGAVHEFVGLRGKDRFVLHGDGDIVDGGASRDTVDYSEADGVRIDLTASAKAGDDMLESIEGVLGSKGDDTIVGSDRRDAIRGGAGDDVIDGRLGADLLWGGPGTDTVTHGLDMAVIVEVAAGTSTGQGTDRLWDFEIYAGSPADDTLNGGQGPDHLRGLDGSDLLKGFAGDDLLEGGPGTDLLLGGAGSDTLDGGPDDDVLAGGEGDDHFDGGLPSSQPALGEVGDTVTFESATGAITASLQSGLATGEGNDALEDVENLIGSLFDDTLRGYDLQAGGTRWYTMLAGLDGDDTLIGSDDPNFVSRLLGGPGDDQLDGRAGPDAADFSGSAAPVIADLRTGIATGEGTDTLISIEDLVGTDGDDVLHGDDGQNVLKGGAGDDRLFGHDDTDWLDGGAGKDRLDGGADFDTCLAGENNQACEQLFSRGGPR